MFFLLQTTYLHESLEGFERLSSSIWRQLIARDEMPLRVAFEGAKFWSIFGLWAIIFAPDMLECQSKTTHKKTHLPLI